MKIAKMLGLVALMALVCVAFTSCGGYSAKDAEKMVQKYDDGKMKEGDYKKCINWYEDATNDAIKELGKVLEDSRSYDQFEKKAEKAGEELDKKYPNFDEIEKILNKSSKKEMGFENYNRYEKIKEKNQEKLKEITEKALKKG